MTQQKVTGLCDSGCGKPAKVWFGRTSVATCGREKCVEVQQDQYAEHCRRMDEAEEMRRYREENY